MRCKRCNGFLALIQQELNCLEYLCISCGREQIVKIPEKVIVKRKQARLKDQIQSLVKEHGVSATAKKLNMPISTVGLWGKGLSKKRKWGWQKGIHSKEFKTKVAQYTIRNRNYYDSAKKFKIARSNIQNWVREYKKHGGEGWDHE